MPDVTNRYRVNFWIDPELRTELKTIKDRDGISESEQMRQAVRAWVQKKSSKRTADVRKTRRRP